MISLHVLVDARQVLFEAFCYATSKRVTSKFRIVRSSDSQPRAYTHIFTLGGGGGENCGCGGVWTVLFKAILIVVHWFSSDLEKYFEYQGQDYICSRPDDNGMHSCSNLPPLKFGECTFDALHNGPISFFPSPSHLSFLFSFFFTLPFTGSIQHSQRFRAYLSMDGGISSKKKQNGNTWRIFDFRCRGHLFCENCTILLFLHLYNSKNIFDYLFFQWLSFIFRGWK